MKRWFILLWLFSPFMPLIPSRAQHWGGSVYAASGEVLSIDRYVKRWLKERRVVAFGAELSRRSLPRDSDAYARDYGYPSFSLGLLYSDNHRVRMHRDGVWGLAEEVDYDSRLGSTLTAYLAFNRPVARHGRWGAAYSLAAGCGYSRLIYNKRYNIDDEFIGSNLNIYFHARLSAVYRFAPPMGVMAGVEFYHHSNGALARPNKGSNILAPMVGLVYEPYEDMAGKESGIRRKEPFTPSIAAHLAVGVGGKTLLEDWQLTQFSTPSSSADYRKEHFRCYMAYSIRGDLMYRWARRWASGIGADLFYGSYASHIKRMDEAGGFDCAHSPWSVGIAVRHQAYYHRLSLAMSFGWYVYREMGYQARLVETPYYETIGLRYAFPSLKGAEAGLELNAHKTKADYTSIVVCFPFFSGRHSRE